MMEVKELREVMNFIVDQERERENFENNLEVIIERLDYIESKLSSIDWILSKLQPETDLQEKDPEMPF